METDSMEEDFVRILREDEGLFGLIAGRVYADYAKQGTDYPYLVLTWVGEDGSPHMTGAGRLAKSRGQIDIYAKDTDTRKKVFAKLRALLDGWTQKYYGDTLFERMDFENKIDSIEEPESGEETNDFRRTVLFGVWFQRSV